MSTNVYVLAKESMLSEQRKFKYVKIHAQTDP